MDYRVFVAEIGSIDDDIIETQFASWFKNYVCVLTKLVLHNCMIDYI